MCANGCGGNCGCDQIVLEQQVGPQGPSGSSSSIIVVNTTSVTTHTATTETVMQSQLIAAINQLLSNNQDTLSITAWFTGGPTADTTVFRLKQNTTAVVAGANTLCSLTVNSKNYRVKAKIELSRLSVNTFKVEGEITLYGGLTSSSSFSGQAPVFPSVTFTSPSNLTSDFYIFGSIQSTAQSNNCSMDYLRIESKKVIV
jgi:hypothetical protein